MVIHQQGELGMAEDKPKSEKRYILSDEERKKRIEKYTELVTKAVMSDGYMFFVARIIVDKKEGNSFDLNGGQSCFNEEALEIISAVNKKVLAENLFCGIIHGS